MWAIVAWLNKLKCVLPVDRLMIVRDVYGRSFRTTKLAGLKGISFSGFVPTKLVQPMPKPRVPLLSHEEKTKMLIVRLEVAAANAAEPASVEPASFPRPAAAAAAKDEAQAAASFGTDGRKEGCGGRHAHGLF